MATTKTDSWGRFKALKDEKNFRLIWRSYGREKVGKSFFGLTAPGPVAIQSFDIGLEGVVEKFVAAGKDVRAVDYEYTNQASQEEAKTILAQFIEDYKVALLTARTIVWDTETELWELFRYAEFGENNNGVATDQPKNYAKLNSTYRDLVQLAYKARVNLQLIQKVKERWGMVNDRLGPTGQFEPTGMKEAGYIVQANIKHTWDKEQGFGIEVINCRQNMALAGETFYTGVGKDRLTVDMPYLAQLVFPDSDEQAWV